MHLPFIAEIYRTRTVPGGTNEYGIPLPATEEEYLALSIPCQFWANVAALRGSQGAPVVDYTMLYPSNYALTSNDTIRTVKRGVGGAAVMDSGTGTILDIAPITITRLNQAQVSWVGG